jgi:RimJ/RimL family protein N-acetyltransferase
MNPVLTDDRFLVRPPTADDVAPLFAAARESIAEVSPWLPWCHANYSQQETQQYVSTCLDAWAQRSRYPFMVFDRGGGQLLGGIAVNHIDTVNRLGSLGYWVRTSRAGQGVMSAAARLVCQFAFAQAGLTRLEIAAMPENRASRRVAEKLGATFECIARNRIVMHGRAYDAALYSLVPSDVAGSPYVSSATDEGLRQAQAERKERW